VNKVFDLLVEHQGNIPFSFQLNSPQGQVEMTFPNVTTAYSPKLKQQMAALIGQDRFTIEWLGADTENR